MKHIKRKLTAVAVVAIVLALLGQATIAYFSTVGRTTNVVTSGGVQLLIHEKTEGNATFPAEGVVILPGDVVKKEVTVESDCDHPFYLRVKLLYDVDDTTLTVADCFAPDINTDDWEEHEGWYYYKKIVKPNRTTAELFSEVEMVGAKIDNSYIGKTLALTVVAQAVQSENNPLTGGKVYTASGWPQE